VASNKKVRGGKPLLKRSANQSESSSYSSLAGRLTGLKSLSAKRIILGYILVTPVVLWRLATTIYPFLYTTYLSFFDHSPVRRTFDFIGLGNYIAIIHDRNIHDTVSFTLYFTVVSVSLQVVLGLAIAELLNRRFFLRSVARAVNLLPWAMSGIVIGTAARWIFDPNYGLVNDLIWRVSGARPLWLVDVSLARLAVTLTDVWKNTAFLAVIFLGGLQGISAELYEAAKIDGADGWRSYRYITLPLLMPLIISMAIFISIYRILSFEIVYALTQGGPGTATSLMSYQVYVQGFRVLNFGYASAISMTLFLMVLVVGLFGFGLLRRAWARL
jgi:multiple sugar transport system permease protein